MRAVDLFTVMPSVGDVISMLMGSATVTVMLASSSLPALSMPLAVRLCDPGASPEVSTTKLKGRLGQGRVKLIIDSTG